VINNKFFLPMKITFKVIVVGILSLPETYQHSDSLKSPVLIREDSVCKSSIHIGLMFDGTSQF